MTVSLDIYRARIGCYFQLAYRKIGPHTKNSFKSIHFKLTLIMVISLLYCALGTYKSTGISNEISTSGYSRLCNYSKGLISNFPQNFSFNRCLSNFYAKYT